MSFLQADFYTIDCLTNTLVGSGKANYGVIDQLVQRDAATHLPVIHASSLKGAVKEFCTHSTNTNGSVITNDDIRNVFGSVKSDKENTGTGLYKFLDAHLLYIPVRSDKSAFIHITCPLVLQLLVQEMELFKKEKLVDELKKLFTLINDNKKNEAYCFSDAQNEAILEDFEFKAVKHSSYKLSEVLNDLLGNEIVLTSNYIFQTLTNDLHLPVIARNHLENGESENLWYEQVIPRTSRFWFTLLKPVNETVNAFDNLVTEKNSVIQIGANATVGYGYTKINLLNL